MRSRREKKIKYFDYPLLFIVIFLLGFGLVMLYSTSSYNAQLKFNDDSYYLKRQLMFVAIGTGAMILVSLFDYHIWRKLAGLGFVLSFVLGFLVIVAGHSSHGQSRWLQIGPVSFQPSEFAKVVAIVVYAIILSNRKKKEIGDLKFILKMLFLAVPIVGPVFLTNLSTSLIILIIIFGMLFVASPKYLQFVAMGLFGIMVLVGYLLLGSGYRSERMQIWLNPENYDKGYQTLQGLYAIGSGGLFGKGLGESMQKLGFVPEAQNDMIFSIICEELGLFGAMCVILLFLLMIWRLMVIATNASDLYGSLLVVGIMIHISVQVILNIAVVTNTIPNTGVTLPFISYGGTSVLFLMIEMGLAMSVSKGIRLE